MRPIDADALSARMHELAFETDSDMQRWDSGCWIRYKMFERAIADAPTIEPERKKGKWHVYVDCEGKTRQCTCSLCGHETDEYCWESPKYCENCGAEMEDGEEEDEEQDWEDDDE